MSEPGFKNLIDNVKSLFEGRFVLRATQFGAKFSEYSTCQLESKTSCGDNVRFILSHITCKLALIINFLNIFQ